MDSSPDEPVHYLVAHVGEALARDPRVGEQGIHVKVVGRKVFLSGEVPTSERREAVATVVTEVLPAYEIHNQVAVSPPAEPSEPELLT